MCDLLAGQPGIGQRIKTKRISDARRHVMGNYLIYTDRLRTASSF
jgi:hypothetical protein